MAEPAKSIDSYGDIFVVRMLHELGLPNEDAVKLMTVFRTYAGDNVTTDVNARLGTEIAAVKLLIKEETGKITSLVSKLTGKVTKLEADLLGRIVAVARDLVQVRADLGGRMDKLKAAIVVVATEQKAKTEKVVYDLCPKMDRMVVELGLVKKELRSIRANVDR